MGVEQVLGDGELQSLLGAVQAGRPDGQHVALFGQSVSSPAM